ncbi:MAG: nucleotide sugar dehydrogenase [Planctomycetota bacterium]|nr:nucleotide sugar dehydrogenase [Planctomycetota bacterium]
MSVNLEQRIRDRSCRYGVVGLGYVGLALAAGFARRGIQVLGFDIDDAKVAAVNEGRSYVPDVDDAEVASIVAAGRLEATTDMGRLAEVDVISICVPTPLSKSRDPDLSYVEAALKSVERSLRPGQLIVLESTTYPGMTEEVLKPRLEKRGLVVGEDIWLAFSPERVDPGNHAYGIHNTPKVVGGVDPASTAMAVLFYGIAVDHVVPVGSAAAAEMAKLLENTFRSVNIGLVNEIAQMCDRLGLDVREIVEAASTKPYGFMRFEPGPGLGGHCIPLDPIYLSWKLRRLDFNARFIELATDINIGMPRYLVERVTSALNARSRSVKGSRVLVMGVAYKRDVDDTRESPALEAMRLLLESGAEVVYADPFVDTLSLDDRLFTALDVTPALLADVDCVVVTTDHTDFPWAAVAAHAHLIVDSRGAVDRDRVQHVLWPLSGPAVRGPQASADQTERVFQVPRENQ